MFKGIEIKNFGIFGKEGQSVPLGNLTYLVGPNNSGKSTVLSAYTAIATLQYHTGISLPPVNSHQRIASIRSHLNSPFFGTQAFRQNGYIADLLKFQNGNDAVFGKQTRQPISLRVNGNFGGDDSALGILLEDFPNFVNVATTLEGSEQANKSLYSALQKSWVFPSYRTFAMPSLQVGSLGTNNMNFGQNGSGMIQFLLERFTSRDDKWEIAEKWLKRIDPNVSILKAPLRGLNASVETGVRLQESTFDVNIAQSGSGIQRALQIICAVVFSDSNSVILIEEPEMNLHPLAQDVLVDLFNTAVNEWGKQIIITTHSWDMILEVYSDIGMQSNGRGEDHVSTKAENFQLTKLTSSEGRAVVESYDLTSTPFDRLKTDFKRLWG
ncbi:MAG: AAA family ATPase [Nitrososphaerota archaeon]|nr:AAA family ATPase [Nitrososphaerota archaeon]